MKSAIGILFVLLILMGCNDQSSKRLDTSQEPLTVEAEARVISWVGYKSFTFELNEMANNFSKEYISKNIKELVSASNAVLYSMPNDIRTDIMNEKANKVVKLTKALSNSLDTKSEESIRTELEELITAYHKLNNEINYVINN